MTRDGRVCPVNGVLAVDSTNDLAIVQVEGKGFTPIPLAPLAAPQGTSIWVLSHPQWRYFTLSAGIVAGYFTAGADDVLQMQITADFAGAEIAWEILVTMVFQRSLKRVSL
jgi:serine protease Do